MRGVDSRIAMIADAGARGRNKGGTDAFCDLIEKLHSTQSPDDTVPTCQKFK